MKNILFIAGLFILIYACTPQDLLTYEGENQLSFKDSTKDTLDFSFAFHPGVESYRFAIPIKLTGMLAEEERFFDIKILEESTAVSGTHYDVLEQKQSFRANSNKDSLFITLKKSDDLSSKRVILAVELCSNEHFIIDAEGYDKTILRFTSLLSRPSWWSNDYHMMGKYSQKKYELFIRETGEADLDYNKKENFTYSDARALVLKFKYWLMDQQPAIMDEDGSKMEVRLPG